MDHKLDMTAVYKATASPEQPLRSCTTNEQVLLCYKQVKWYFLKGYNDTAFPEIACEIRGLTENSPVERIQSETTKKIRGPEGVTYRELLKNQTHVLG